MGNYHSEPEDLPEDWYRPPVYIAPRYTFSAPEGEYKLVPPMFSGPICDKRIRKHTDPIFHSKVKLAQFTFPPGTPRVTQTSVPSEAEETLLAFNSGREVYIHRYRGPFTILEPEGFIYATLFPVVPTCLEFSALVDHSNNINDYRPSLGVGFHGGQIGLAHENKLLNHRRHADTHRVTCIAGYPGNPNRWVASYASGCLYVFEKNTDFLLAYPHFELLKEGDGYKVFFNKKSGACSPVYRWIIGNGPLYNFAFSPDDSLLATVGFDGFLRVFDFEEMELVAKMRSNAALRTVAWSPDGKYVAVAGGDMLITLFDVVNKVVLLRGMGHVDAISKIIFDPYVIFDLEKSGANPDNPAERVRYRICSVAMGCFIALWDITEAVLIPYRADPDENGQPNNLKKKSRAETDSQTFSWYIGEDPPTRSFSLRRWLAAVFRRIADCLRRPSRFTQLQNEDAFIGTPECPFIEDVHVIYPVGFEKISDEELCDIIVREDSLVTSSVDGFVCTWLKPNKINIPEGWVVPKLKNSQISI